MFQGVYNGAQKHPSDLDIVLERSWQTGLDKIIITVGTLTDVKDAAEIARKDGNLDISTFIKFNRTIHQIPCFQIVCILRWAVIRRVVMSLKPIPISTMQIFAQPLRRTEIK